MKNRVLQVTAVGAAILLTFSSCAKPDSAESAGGSAAKRPADFNFEGTWKGRWNDMDLFLLTVAEDGSFELTAGETQYAGMIVVPDYDYDDDDFGGIVNLNFAGMQERKYYWYPHDQGKCILELDSQLPGVDGIPSLFILERK